MQSIIPLQKQEFVKCLDYSAKQPTEVVTDQSCYREHAYELTVTNVNIELNWDWTELPWRSWS